MREILFRGKTITSKEWIYGDLLQYAGGAQIWENTEQGKFNAQIIPETVGQYTGLRDKNSTRIFEGDILKMSFGKDTLYATVNFGEYNQPDKILRSHLGFYFDFVNTDNCESFRKDVGYWTGRTFLEIEVIGNIHDNPELLGRGAKNDG